MYSRKVALGYYYAMVGKRLYFVGERILRISKIKNGRYKCRPFSPEVDVLTDLIRVKSPTLFLILHNPICKQNKGR